MSRALLALVVLLGLASAALAAPTEEDGVLVLTNENFDETIQSNEFILVEFYAPWCGHCKSLAPEYAKAAKQLKDSGDNIALGKVDATQEEELAERFEVRGYPTLKFFRNGNPTEYTGGRQAADIVSWLRKKSGPAFKTLESVDAANAFVDNAEHKVTVLGLFKNTDSAERQTFEKVAASTDEVPFALSSSQELFDKYNVQADSAVLLFKKFDEGRVDYTGAYDLDEIKTFISGNLLPLVAELNNDNAAQIFGGNIRNHLLVFLAKSSSSYETHLQALRPVAQAYKGRLLVVVVDVEEDSNGNIVSYFDISADSVPQVRLIRMGDRELQKFRPESNDIDADKITSFANDFFEGKLKQFLKTQDVPADWDQQPVKVLVGKNHDEVAHDSTKNVFVEYYAPWCGHCKKLFPIWDELADKFKDRSDVIIAKLDATANEVASVHIEGFPTLKFYKAGSDKEAVDYQGSRTLDDLVSFVEKHAVRSGESADTEAPKDEL